MITIGTLTERVQLLLNKQSDDSDIDGRELELSVRANLGSVIRKRFFEYKNIDVAEVHGGLVMQFRDIEVKYDKEVCQYYSELPASTVWLLHDAAIRNLRPMKGDNVKSYDHLPNGFSSLYDELDAGMLEGNVGYYIMNDRIYYENMDPAFQPSAVRLEMVPAYESLGYNEPMNVPHDIQDEVVKLVTQEYSTAAKQPDDETSDNIDRQ